MSKKLMMNNYSDDAIVLCKDFSPNGQPFVLLEKQIIDWDKYELYINVDMRNATQEWHQILMISVDNITTWSGDKLHLYGSPNKLRIQPVVANGNNIPLDLPINDFDKSQIEILFNKKGVYLQDKLVANMDYYYMRDVFDKLKTKPNIIGDARLDKPQIFHYNLVQLQAYQERI